MTRFARAKGSKASNERLPQDATSWETMKKELHKAQKEQQESVEREKINKIRQAKYENFLEEITSNTKTEWAKFPNKTKNTYSTKTKSKNKSPSKKNIKVKSSNTSDNNGWNIEISNLETGIKQSNKPNKNKKKSTNKISNLDDQEVSTLKLHSNKNIKQKSLCANDNKNTEISNLETGIKQSNKPNNNNKKSTKGISKQSNKFNKNKKKSTNKISNAYDQEESILHSETQPSNNDNNDMIKQQNNVQAEVKAVAKGQKRKRKVLDYKEHKRRKPEPAEPRKVTINDKEEEIVKFDGFPLTKSDAIRLHRLRRKLISKAIPRSEVFRTIASERRKAEKFLSKVRKTICFNCRVSGHLLSQCPQLENENFESMGTGICFKCGSTEHNHTTCNIKLDTFKFALCFICKEQGHIARQCPDNPKGLYPEGGACKLCGEVTHFKKDCPKNMLKTQDIAVANMISNDNIESLDEEIKTVNGKKSTSQKRKIIKF